ncbi:unnamed protein product [Orchesella dallaii]|uniref:UVR domain-containing protein n=1 Tax=Orchesella dallaii TaxID=48710 RepID=A0ABP1PLD2_9HEXA
MLERINFRVIHATSEDPSFPSSELERHGPGVNGWRSAKAATFPQELILQLESRAKLGHIQILAHQYIIPETIELHIGEFLGEQDGSGELQQSTYSNKIDLDKAHFILLGHVTMARNDSTGFKARELKSISVECRGSLVKLLIQNNYSNKYCRNQQQVALVAINLLGEKLEDDDEMTKSASQITFEEMLQSERDKSLFSPYDDLAFTMYVDIEVQDLIRKMDHKKQEAVLDERFDYASKLKSSIEHLRKAGELLAKYQLEKQIAASREDFQRAKEKKTQMDTYRDNLYKTLRVKQLLEPNGRVPENDEPGKVLGISGMTRSVTELSLPPTTSSAASTPAESTTSERFSSRLTTPDNEKKESGYYSNDEPKFPPPLFIKKRRPVTSVERIKEPKEDSYTSPSAPCAGCIRPSNMSERARRYAALPIQVFGDALVEKMFSKNFAVKEDGLRCLQKTLSDYKRGDKKTDPPSKIFRAASLLLQRTIKDTIFSVFNLTIQTLVYLMDDFARKHRLPASELSQGLERILPELLSKSGDTALGKNKVATECILKLQSCQHVRILHVISSNLTKPFDIPVHPRLAQSKAEMVEELLTNYGLSAEKHSGLTARDFVEFGVSALNQPSESVRRVAERIIISLYHTHPKLVRQNLPLEEDVSPKNVQYRQLFQQFDKIDKEVSIDRKDGGMVMNSIIKESKSTHQMTSSVYIPKI